MFTQLALQWCTNRLIESLLSAANHFTHAIWIGWDLTKSFSSIARPYFSWQTSYFFDGNSTLTIYDLWSSPLSRSPLSPKSGCPQDSGEQYLYVFLGSSWYSIVSGSFLYEKFIDRKPAEKDNLVLKRRYALPLYLPTKVLAYSYHQLATNLLS